MAIIDDMDHGERMKHATNEIFNNRPHFLSLAPAEIFNCWLPRMGGGPRRLSFFTAFLLTTGASARAEDLAGPLFYRLFSYHRPLRTGGGSRRPPFLSPSFLPPASVEIFNCWPLRMGGGPRRPPFLSSTPERPNFNCWPLI